MLTRLAAGAATLALVGGLTAVTTTVTATSAQAAAKAPKIKVTAKVPTRALAPQQAFKVTGKLSARGKRYVVLQRKVGTKWRLLANGFSKRSGAFTIKGLAPSKVGNHKVRVRVPRANYAKPVRRAGESRVRTLKVRHPKGSVANPHGLESFRVETDETTWQVKMLLADSDVSDIQGPMADAPKAGQRYIAVRLRVSNIGRAASTPSDSLFVSYRARNATLYTNFEGGSLCAFDSGQGFADASQVAVGGTVEGYACAIVPSNLVTGGLWSLAADSTFHHARVPFAS